MMYRNARGGRSAAKNWQARSFDRIAIYIYIILSTDSQKPEAEAGSRKPEARSRKLEAGSWKLEAGSRKPEAGSRKPEAGSRKPEAGMNYYKLL